MKLRKGDTVIVKKGRDRGKKGKILKIFPANNAAIVEGVNMVKKHLRRTRENPKGGIMVREGAVKIPNLMLICPQTSKPTRIGYMILVDGAKKRISWFTSVCPVVWAGTFMTCSVLTALRFISPRAPNRGLAAS